MSTIKFFPVKVHDTDIVFGGGHDYHRLLPLWEDIPAEFNSHHNKWATLVSNIFFKGGSVADWVAVDGIDRSEALRHFKAILGSFGPKHEHKIAGRAYMLSMWFTEEPVFNKDKDAV